MSDVGRQPEIEMVACKPEVVKTQEWNEIAAKSPRLPHIFGHGRLIGTGPDIVRCRPTTGYTMAVYTPEVVITQERHEISARYQRILGISTTPNTLELSSALPEQTGLLADIGISGCRSDVGRHRTMLEIAPACWAWSKMCSRPIRLNFADISYRS